MTKKRLLIVGSGGHALSVLNSVTNDYEIVGIIDDCQTGRVYGYDIFGTVEDLKILYEQNHFDNVFIAIGSPYVRKQLFDKINSINCNWLTNIVSDSSIVKDSLSLVGKNIFIGEKTYLGPEVLIYDNVLVNTGSIIEHETKVNAHSSIYTSVTINGNCTVGELCEIGSGTIFKPNTSICDKVIIGAQSLILKSIDSPGTYVGSPVNNIKN